MQWVFVVGISFAHTATAADERAARLDEVAHVAALRAYAERASELRRSALGRGVIDYKSVLGSAYPTELVTDSLWQSKARWRSTLGAPFAFYSDYSLATVPTTVQPLQAALNARLQSTLVAQYEATANVIGIATTAADFAIFHEAGHALQRAMIATRRGLAGRHATRSASDAPATTVDRQRLDYLCAQDEFEVRLQDLNRFYAVLVAGHAIMNPNDSLRALIALGVPLEFEEVRDAFSVGGLDLSRATFDDCSSVAVIPRHSSQIAFEDAHELGWIRQLCATSDRPRWQRMLAKILFEAPGHL